MKFNFTNNQPIYIQLVEQMEIAIISGRLAPGDRLPPVRELATEAKVNPNTMMRALSELEAKGLIYTERTNGKFVTQNERKIERALQKFISKRIDNLLEDMEDLGLRKRDLIKFIKHYGGNNE